MIEEIKGLFGRDRVALFLDGMDKLPPERARTCVRALLDLQHIVDLVVVVSPALVYGPDSYAVLGDSRVWWIPNVPCDTPQGSQFLGRVAARRLGKRRVPKAIAPVCEEAVRMSGGVTGMFLHLLRDAALYAAASGRARPTSESLARAARDRTDAMRRLLVAGDLEHLRAADGVSGTEVPHEKKIRLLAQNLLLEYEEGQERIVRPNPLLAPLLGPRGIA